MDGVKSENATVTVKGNDDPAASQDAGLFLTRQDPGCRRGLEMRLLRPRIGPEIREDLLLFRSRGALAEPLELQRGGTGTTGQDRQETGKQQESSAIHALA